MKQLTLRQLAVSLNVDVFEFISQLPNLSSTVINQFPTSTAFLGFSTQGGSFNSYWQNNTNVLQALLYQFIFMFGDVIPYNQTSIDEIICQVLNYFQLYLPNIITWQISIKKLEAIQKMIADQQTGTQTLAVNLGSQTQNQALSSTSFNPVASTSTVEVNVLQPASINEFNTASQSFQASGKADFTTSTTAGNYSQKTNTDIAFFNMSTLNVLQQYARQSLIPLWKKVGTLFWFLSDTNNSNDSILGFNIWK